MKNRKLEFFVGVLIGIVTPVVVSEFLRISFYPYITWDAVKEFSLDIYMPVIKLGTFANLIPFLIMNKINWESGMKGLLSVTLVIAFVILGYIYL
jgi:hypothetical protein